MNVWDALSPAQIASVTARTDAFNLTGPLQAAINSASVLEWPPGSYRHDDTLFSSKPIIMRGSGQGSIGYPHTISPTQLTWGGGSKPMFVYGANGGEPFSGGGISGMAFDARGSATECLQTKDAIRFSFSDLNLANATQKVLSLTNSRAQPYPTGYGTLQNIFVTATGNANALWVGSDHPELPVNGADGVTMMTLIGCHFSSDQGDSVIVTDRGDHFTWIHTTTGHRGGHGTNFTGNPLDPANSVISMHVWVNPIGDFHFARGMGGGHRIINLDMADVANPVYADPRNMISGEGASEVTVDSALVGYMWGQNKTLGYRESIRHDAMFFMDWDKPKNLLHTAQGTWKTLGNVTDGKQLGGAILLSTDAHVGDQAALIGELVDPSLRPNTVFSVAPISNTDVIIRCGWQDATGQGIYIEVDTAIPWAGWRFVCKDGSGQTSLNSKYPFNLGSVSYMTRIELQPGMAGFHIRDVAFQFWDSQTITTNVPTVPMSWVYQIINKGTGKSMLVSDYKRGFNTEEVTT